MSDANSRPGPDILTQATGALRDAPVPAGPPADLTAATVAAVESRFTTARRADERRRTIMRYVRYGSAAAAAVVAATAAGVLWVGGGTAVALDKALDKAVAAEAVRYQVRESFNGQPERTHTVTVKDKVIRIDDLGQPGFTWVVDWEEKAALILQADAKKYQTVDLAASAVVPFDGAAQNVREQFLQLKKQKAELEATEKVAGGLADRYAVTGGKAFHQTGNWTVWVDRKSQLPVQVRMETDIRESSITRVYEKFDWKPKIEDGTFSLDPPAGYTEGSVFRVFPPLQPRKKK